MHTPRSAPRLTLVRVSHHHQRFRHGYCRHHHRHRRRYWMNLLVVLVLVLMVLMVAGLAVARELLMAVAGLWVVSGPKFRGAGSGTRRSKGCLPGLVELVRREKEEKEGHQEEEDGRGCERRYARPLGWEGFRRKERMGVGDCRRRRWMLLLLLLLLLLHPMSERGGRTWRGHTLRVVRGMVDR